MASFTGSMRMRMNAAGEARARACGLDAASLAWQAVDAAADRAAKQGIAAALVDVPAFSTTHRHRRPRGTS